MLLYLAQLLAEPVVADRGIAGQVKQPILRGVQLTQLGGELLVEEPVRGLLLDRLCQVLAYPGGEARAEPHRGVVCLDRLLQPYGADVWGVALAALVADAKEVQVVGALAIGVFWMITRVSTPWTRLQSPHNSEPLR
ncbi:hypothetical protein [Nocardiopsis rhodophaea]|uniref:hypothetical protein n=1 Tax=Nocardiopsis rhodophaea TaxID=280238 RepID=UPI0031D77DA2